MPESWTVDEFSSEEQHKGWTPDEFVSGEESIGPSEQGPLQRLRNTAIARKLLGPTDIEREGMAGGVSGSQMGLLEIPEAMLKATTPSELPGVSKAYELSQKLDPLTYLPDAIKAAGGGLLPQQIASIPSGIEAGVGTAALGFPLAPLPAGGTKAGLAILGSFGAQYLASQPEQYAAFKEAISKGDLAEAAKILTGDVVTGAALGLGSKHAIDTIREGAKVLPKAAVAAAEAVAEAPSPEPVAAPVEAKAEEAKPGPSTIEAISQVVQTYGKEKTAAAFEKYLENFNLQDASQSVRSVQFALFAKNVLAKEPRALAAIETKPEPNDFESQVTAAAELFRKENKASVSLLQRTAKMGYTKAVAVVDELEKRGVIGPSRGPEPREVFQEQPKPEPVKPKPIQEKGPENAIQPESPQLLQPVRQESGEGVQQVPAEGPSPQVDEGGGQEASQAEVPLEKPVSEIQKIDERDRKRLNEVQSELDDLKSKRPKPTTEKEAWLEGDPMLKGQTKWDAPLEKRIGELEHEEILLKDGLSASEGGSKASGDVQLTVLPGAKEFIEQDVIPATVAGAQNIVESVKGVENLLSAPTVSEPAKAGAGIIRERAAELAQKDVQSRRAFAKARNEMAGWTPDQSLQFIDRVESGSTKHLTPEMKKVTAGLRDALNQRVRDVRALGTGKMKTVIEDYFPHIWKNPTKATNLIARIMGKRPLTGTKAFLKQRTIPRTLDGVRAGLEPVTWNPIDLTLLKLHEMDKYVMGQKIMQEFKDQGLAKFSRSDIPPEGYAKINDSVGNVVEYRPTTRADGTEGAPERVIQGHWFVQEDAARVMNNYLSPGLEKFAWYRALRWFGNNLNMANLGLSAYHFTFSMIDSSTSKLALGIEQSARGNLKKGIPNIVRGVVGLPGVNQLEAYLKGSKVLKEYTKPGSVGGDYAKIVDSLIKGGGRVEMPQIFQNSTLKNFFDAAKSGNYPGAILRAPFAAIHAVAYPLMNVIVPRMKLGIFSDMARDSIQKMGPGATHAQLRSEMGKIWDSVDNRLGELVYDNLFWNKTLKDTSFLAVRSVGWNLGTLRELGGGVKDTATIIQRLKQGDNAVSRRMAYTIALPMTVGVMGAMYQYLRTGKGPQETKDYFYPKTGNLLPSGEPERVNFPSYLKDVESVRRHPVQTVLNKAHPSIGLIGNMLQNKDYYGTEVIHPDDPLVRKVADEMEFVAKSFVPYTAQGMKKRGEVQEGIEPKVESFFGIMPLPGELTRSSAENLAINLLRAQMPQGSRTREQAERSQTEGRAIGQIKMGKMNIDQAVEQGLVSPERANVVDKRANMPYLAYAVTKLNANSALKVYEKSTPKERELIAPLVESKINRSKALSPSEKDLLRARFDAVTPSTSP